MNSQKGVISDPLYASLGFAPDFVQQLEGGAICVPAASG